MSVLSPKVSIVGCGRVAMRYAFSMVTRGLVRELALVDYFKDKAEGEAMDLLDGSPFTSQVNVHAGDYPDTANSDLVVVTAGAGRKPGQTRLDLVKGNVEIIKKIIPEIVKYSPNAIILMVSNPVDILAYAAYKISGKPSNEVIGSGTLLDTARLANLLKPVFDVNINSIYAPIFGEHGDSSFPAWSLTTIGGVPLKNALNLDDKGFADYKTKLNSIFEDAKNRGREVIKRKGETSYGIGLSLTRISQAILKDEGAVLPVSTLLKDYHGVSDVYLSVPASVSAKGIKKVYTANFNEEEIAAFKKSADTVKAVIKEIGF